MALPFVKPHSDVPPFVTAPVLALPGIAHGFFGRRGGVSSGFYESLNSGFLVGDDPASVTENRARIAQQLGVDPQKLFSVKQVHSNVCVAADGSFAEADAMIATQPGVALGILTADCAPVLFAGEGVVGAAHAGWGGALKGILEATLEAMQKAGAKNIRAAIGPCIGAASYEVSAGFEQPFLQEDFAAEKFFKGGTADKLFFDLPGYCAFRLARAGMGAVAITGQDTLAMEDAYFSHRRSTKRAEPARGLQIAAISLKN